MPIRLEKGFFTGNDTGAEFGPLILTADVIQEQRCWPLIETLRSNRMFPNLQS